MDQETTPLPHNLEAERSLLGAIFRNNDLYFEASEIVVKGDFFESWNGELFILIGDHLNANRRATVTSILHDVNQDADVGGLRASEVLAIIERSSVPAVSEVVREMAIQIRDLAMRRRAIDAALQIIADIHAAPVTIPAEELRAKMDATMATLFASTADLGLRHVFEAASDVLTTIEKFKDTAAGLGLALPLAHVEELTGPFAPGKLYVLGGASGSGKSALAQQIAEFIGREEAGKNVLFMSMEMGVDPIAERALAARTGISTGDIGRAKINREQHEVLFEAGQKLRGVNLWVDGTTMPSAGLIAAKARRMKRLKGLDLLVLDHLLHIGPVDPRLKEHENIRLNLQAINRLSKELAIPILLLAQLRSGAGEDRVVRRPRPSDLYNAGAVLQEAHVLFFVHRPEHLLREREPEADKGESTEHRQWADRVEAWAGRAEAILYKNRYGESFGVRELGFIGERVRFADDPNVRHFKDQPAALSDDDREWALTA